MVISTQRYCFREIGLHTFRGRTLLPHFQWTGRSGEVLVEGPAHAPRCAGAPRGEPAGRGDAVGFRGGGGAAHVPPRYRGRRKASSKCLQQFPAAICAIALQHAKALYNTHYMVLAFQAGFSTKPKSTKNRAQASQNPPRFVIATPNRRQIDARDS